MKPKDKIKIHEKLVKKYIWRKQFVKIRLTIIVISCIVIVGIKLHSNELMAIEWIFIVPYSLGVGMILAYIISMITTVWYVDSDIYAYYNHLREKIIANENSIKIINDLKSSAVLSDDDKRKIVLKIKKLENENYKLKLELDFVKQKEGINILPVFRGIFFISNKPTSYITQCFQPSNQP